MNHLLALTLAIAFLLIAIIRFKIHPFLVLIITALLYGFTAGMAPELILQSFSEGFGGIMGKVGLIIIFGVMIGTILEKSGGALVIATKILNLIGKKSVHAAMLLTGYLVSIPVFADSAFVMLNSLNKSLSFRAGVSYAGTAAALALGLTATHTMVPPTPGPIAAAGILDADLTMVILLGLAVSFISLIACYFFATKVASKVKLPIHLEATQEAPKASVFPKSLLSILIPLLLILLKSVAEYPSQPLGEGSFFQIAIFLGNPIIALLIGVLIALTIPKKLDAQILSSTGWLGRSLEIAAPILLVTGAGGIFGKVLQNSGLAEVISEGIVSTQLGLLFPFLLAVLLKSAQGSSTVSLVTTASIVAPLMPSLGLETDLLKALTVLAIGAGSAVVSHINDSFFWVMTQLTGMNVKQGLQVQSLGTAVLGGTAMLIIYLVGVLG